MKLALLLALAAFSACAQTASDPLHATHDALFETFLPLREVHQRPAAEKMFWVVRDEIWKAASDSPRFQQLLSPFLSLHSFGTACHIAEYLREARINAFSALSLPERQHV